MRHEIASRVLRRLAPPPYRGRVDARSTARRDRQVIRILGIVRALSQGERLTLRQLQARFSASRETIYRDVKAIQAIGYPVVGDEAGSFPCAWIRASGGQPRRSRSPGRRWRR